MIKIIKNEKPRKQGFETSFFILIFGLVFGFIGFSAMIGAISNLFTKDFGTFIASLFFAIPFFCFGSVLFLAGVLQFTRRKLVISGKKERSGPIERR